MTTTRRETIRAGVFVLISGIVFVLFLVVLMGRSWFRSEKTYYTVFDSSVEGLDEGSPVKYLGVPAGTVSDIRFEPNNFPKIQVTMKLREYITVKEGTKAKLVLATLTGIGHIELISGMTGEQEISDGARIPSEASFFEKVYQTIPEIFEKLPRVLDRIEEASANLGKLTGPENQKKFKEALSRLEEILDTFGTEVRLTGREARTSLKETREEIQKTLGQVRDLLAGEKVEEILKGFKTFSEKLASSSERIDKTISRLDISLRSDEKALSESLIQLREAIRAGRDLLDRLRQDPSVLIFSSPLPEREIPEPSR